jgi:hypothetical protein
VEVGKLREADAAIVEGIVFAKLLPANAQYMIYAPTTQLMKLRNGSRRVRLVILNANKLH